MGIFSKTTAETPVRNLTFAEKMANIKAAFKTAYDDANTLHGEMEQEIAFKKAKANELFKQISEIEVTKEEAKTFMANISKLI